MTRFEKEFFQKFDFSDDQIKHYWDNALRDLRIAREDEFSEVKFTYAYQALIKAGITLIAKAGLVKIRSVSGHHMKILTKMSEILKNPDILTIGNAMRMKRNLDLYSGGEIIGGKESEDFLRFVSQVLKKVKSAIL